MVLLLTTSLSLSLSLSVCVCVCPLLPLSSSLLFSLQFFHFHLFFLSASIFYLPFLLFFFLYTQFLFFFFFCVHFFFSFHCYIPISSHTPNSAAPSPIPLSLALLSSPSIPTNNLDFFFSSPFPFLPLYSPSSIRNRALTFLFPPCPLDSPPRAHHPTLRRRHSLTLSLSLSYTISLGPSNSFKG